MYDDLPLIDNETTHSFEVIIDGHRAFIDYQKRGDVYLLIHTEVPKQLEGKGIAAALVEKTFKHLEANHFKIKIYCEYIEAYLKRHPAWNRLLAQ